MESCFPCLVRHESTSARSPSTSSPSSPSSRDGLDFDPRLIPLDKGTVILEAEVFPSSSSVCLASDVVHMFASITFCSESKQWSILQTSKLPLIEVNSKPIGFERTVLKPQDVIAINGQPMKTVSYRFHHAKNSPEPLAGCTSSCRYAFRGLPWQSRKRPRSNETRREEKKREDESKDGSEIGLIEQFQELLGELTCVICSDLFYRTQNLMCGHSFCKDCIDEWLSVQLTCPICRKAVMKPPAASLVTDKSVAVLIHGHSERKKAHEDKKALSEKRLRDSLLAEKKLKKLVAYATKLGHRVVAISEKWSQLEQHRFLRGAKGYRGAVREAYCATTSFDVNFIENAQRKDLILAVQNLGLKPANLRKEAQVDLKSVWENATTEALRTRLLMFIRWS